MTRDLFIGKNDREILRELLIVITMFDKLNEHKEV